MQIKIIQKTKYILKTSQHFHILIGSVANNRVNCVHSNNVEMVRLVQPLWRTIKLFFC